MAHRKSHPRQSFPSAKKMKTVALEKDPLYRRPFRHRLLVILSPIFVLFLVIGYFASRSFSFGLREAEKSKYSVYSYDIVNVFDHDPKAFTQGLAYAGNNTLYESTGMYGQSSVRKVQLQTGEVKQLHQMEKRYFGEGLALMDSRLFQVAWQTNLSFIYNMENLTQLKTFQHPMRDGWGLATDGEFLFGSDGSSTIYVIQPTTFAEYRRFIVKDREKEIYFLNELEYVKNEIWANVWQSNCIARISPENGKVLGWILLHDLRSNLVASGYKNFDVLNGIAWDSDHDRIYVTGKYWPKLYEIKLHPHPKKFEQPEDIWRVCRV